MLEFNTFSDFHTHTHIHIHIHIYIYTHIYTYTYTHTHIYTYTHTYTYTVTCVEDGVFLANLGMITINSSHTVDQSQTSENGGFDIDTEKFTIELSDLSVVHLDSYPTTVNRASFRDDGMCIFFFAIGIFNLFFFL